jgi:hypothetical protein
MRWSDLVSVKGLAMGTPDSMRSENYASYGTRASCATRKNASYGNNVTRGWNASSGRTALRYHPLSAVRATETTLPRRSHVFPVASRPRVLVQRPRPLQPQRHSLEVSAAVPFRGG